MVAKEMSLKLLFNFQLNSFIVGGTAPTKVFKISICMAARESEEGKDLVQIERATKHFNLSSGPDLLNKILQTQNLLMGTFQKRSKASDISFLASLFAPISVLLQNLCSGAGNL